MKVSVVRTKAHYPSAPFHPSVQYPEYPFSKEAISSKENTVYDAVRKALYLTGMDREHYGTPNWNPLGELVKGGSRIVIKPNFVNHYNLISDDRAYFEALVTQASVIRPLIDYVILATKGEVTLTITDLPIQLADFRIISKKTGLDEVIDFIKDKINRRGTIELVDLRNYQLKIDQSGAILSRQEQPGDPHGYVIINLGKHSNLVSLDKDAHLFRTFDYDSSITVQMHSNGMHKYSLPRTILESDFFINIPKLKIHSKAGSTMCLKNIVGIAGDKQYLPHWRKGTPEAGGDEQPISTIINSLRGRYSFTMRSLGKIGWKLVQPIGRTLVRLNKMAHKNQPLVNITSGDWYGNDTVWRMVHDLNCILFYSDAQGVLHDKPQRRCLNIVDGIIGGEGKGPLSPRPVASGVVVAGFDPLGVDICCTRLMGFDWRKIPQYAKYNVSQRYAFSKFDGNPRQIEAVLSENGEILSRSLDQILPAHHFEPTEGWKGHIEL